MSFCTTCLQPGIRDGQHDCPGIGEIQVSRHRGRGVVVDHAPARALIGLRIIRDLAWPANIAEVGDPDLVNIADQVLYRVVGYDPGHASLIVELVEDWRKPGVLTFDRQLTEAEVEEIKARWQEAYAKGQAAHVVTEIRADDPPVQCWHYEPGSPCDWDVCRQPERLAAGDRGTDKEQP